MRLDDIPKPFGAGGKSAVSPVTERMTRFSTMCFPLRPSRTFLATPVGIDVLTGQPKSFHWALDHFAKGVETSDESSST
jgi:hypothetical protein